ncbi:hypothetical protein SAMN02910382_02993 [Butyrivibrio sp. TB]|nr:hypothetical protein SAMN02910382_02993 [Butyrivibrio sp. TB]
MKIGTWQRINHNGFWDADKVGTVKEVKVNGENMWTDEPYSLDSKVKVTYYCND